MAQVVRLCGLTGILLALACAMSSTAYAQIVSLSWDSCGGPYTKSFACDRNTGSDTVVVTFVPPADFAKVHGAQVAMYVCYDGTGVQDWWQVLGDNSCRSGALTAVAAAPAAGCGQAWPASGTSQWISPILFGPDGFSFNVTITANDPASALDMVRGREIELVRLVVSHAGTVGPGACTGCSRAANIGEIGLFLFSNVEGTHQIALGGAYVTWQDPNVFCHVHATPIRNQTWGQVKSLYR